MDEWTSDEVVVNALVVVEVVVYVLLPLEAAVVLTKQTAIIPFRAM